MTDLTSWSLFLSAFLSSTLLPGGSEAVLAYLTRAQGQELGWLLAVASVGNTLGGMTSWLVGRLIAIRVPLIASDEEKQHQSGPTTGRVRSTHRDIGDSGKRVCGTHPTELTKERVLPRHSFLIPRPSAKAVERLRRWGAPVLLLSWLPVIGDPLCVAAGWLRVHWLLSLVLIGIGKTARYAVVVFLFM